MTWLPLQVDEQPDSAMDRLYYSDLALYERIDRWFDRIEANPMDRDVRPRRFSKVTLPCWCITIPMSDGADYVILWELYGNQPRVHYVGPASFA